MGLDIYAGPLCRYYAGNWQTVVQQWGEEQGIPVDIVRPGSRGLRAVWDRLASFIQSRRQTDPVALVCSWREQLARSPVVVGEGDWDWPESNELGYRTDKPGFDGYGAVQLWAAYAQQSEVCRPHYLPSDWTSDSIFQKAAGSATTFPNMAQAELWLPVQLAEIFEAKEPTGYRAKIGSVFALWSELHLLNSLSWQADEDTIHLWRQVDWDPQSLESTARWAFSIWYCLTEFAVAERVPMRLDY